MTASSVALTEMSSPGKSSPQLLLERRDRRLDDEVVLLAIGRAPDDQADRAWRLAVDENLVRLHDRGVGDRGIRDRDADDVEVDVKDGGASRRQRHALDARQWTAVRSGGRPGQPAPDPA